MHVVMGATGGVGGAVARTLLDRGEDVTVVTRSADRAAPWADRGVPVAVADARDADALRTAFRHGRRAFLMNPLGDPAGDLDADEDATAGGILQALDGSGLEKVVLASTYGARSGRRIGDLGTLWQLEQGLRAQPIPAAVNRGAYYFSNWEFVAGQVRSTGVLTTMLPEDLRIPMVAPEDLGAAAADRLQSDTEDAGVAWIEGPSEYTSGDVARAFAAAFGRDVRVEVTPREAWRSVFERQGFSAASAASFAGMTALTLMEREPAECPVRGTTTLEAYVRRLVAGDQSGLKR